MFDKNDLILDDFLLLVFFFRYIKNVPLLYGISIGDCKKVMIVTNFLFTVYCLTKPLGRARVPLWSQRLSHQLSPSLTASQFDLPNSLAPTTDGFCLIGVNLLVKSPQYAFNLNIEILSTQRLWGSVRSLMKAGKRYIKADYVPATFFCHQLYLYKYPRICVRYTRKGSVFICMNIFYLDIVLSPYNHAERSKSISSMTFLLFFQNCEKDDNPFLTDCPLHEEERNSFFQFISILNKTFILLTKKNKYISG